MPVAITTHPVYGLPPGTRRLDTFASRVIASLPIVYWRMAEAAGASIAKDEMGAYDGTYSAATLGVAPLRPATANTSMSNSAGIGLQGPSFPSLTAWTIALWVKSTTTTTFGFFLTLGETAGSMVRLGGGGAVVRYSEGTGWTSSAVPFALNERAWFAVTWDGATGRIYKNGNYYAVTSRINRNTEAAAWAVSGPNGSGTNVSDFAGWDRCLSAAEIKALFLASQ